MDDEAKATWDYWAGVEAAREDVGELGIVEALQMHIGCPIEHIGDYGACVVGCPEPETPMFQAGYIAHVNAVWFQEAARYAQRATEH